MTEKDDKSQDLPKGHPEERTSSGSLRAIPPGSKPHFEIGDASTDLSEATIQLDINALSLGLEIPALLKKNRDKSPTEPISDDLIELAQQLVEKEAGQDSPDELEAALHDFTGSSYPPVGVDDFDGNVPSRKKTTLLDPREASALITSSRIIVQGQSPIGEPELDAGSEDLPHPEESSILGHNDATDSEERSVVGLIDEAFDTPAVSKKTVVFDVQGGSDSGQAVINESDFRTVAVSPDQLHEALAADPSYSGQFEAGGEDQASEMEDEDAFEMFDDRTIEADLSVLSQGMMSFEDSRKGGRTESDVRLLAQQLTSDIRESHNSLDDRTPVSDDLGHLAIQIAKSVVKKRSDPQAETSPGDMSQLSKEIEEQIKLVNATQQLDFRSRNAMQELAFDLASQLENESIKTGARQEQFGLEHTVELDSLEGMIVDDKTLPRGEVPAVIMASSQPQRSPASADEPQELESAAPIDAAGGIPAESDKQLIQLGLDATFETDGLSAPAQKIVEPAPAEAAPLPVVVKAAPQMKPPITTPTRNPNKVYMIISVLLLSLIVALSATAAYLYFR